MEPGREEGTWLAIRNHNGTVKLAALLNVTGEPIVPNALGRGFLVGDYLKSDVSSTDYSNQLIQSTNEYSAFLLLTAEIKYE